MFIVLSLHNLEAESTAECVTYIFPYGYRCVFSIRGICRSHLFTSHSYAHSLELSPMLSDHDLSEHVTRHRGCSACHRQGGDVRCSDYRKTRPPRHHATAQHHQHESSSGGYLPARTTSSQSLLEKLPFSPYRYYTMDHVVYSSNTDNYRKSHSTTVSCAQEALRHMNKRRSSAKQ